MWYNLVMNSSKMSWSHILIAIAAGVCWGIMLARFVPELTDVQPVTWFVLGVLLALKPIGARLFHKATVS